jgi:hypothetical protein
MMVDDMVATPLRGTQPWGPVPHTRTQIRHSHAVLGAGDHAGLLLRAGVRRCGGARVDHLDPTQADTDCYHLLPKVVIRATAPISVSSDPRRP